MASAGLYAIIRALTLKATKEAAKSAQRDADEVVPKVYRPTDAVSYTHLTLPTNREV